METSKPFTDFFKAFTENSCGAVNFLTLQPDTTGYGLEIYPEKRRKFDHKPTYNELLHFYEDNRTLFEKYPVLRLGWDRTKKQGLENDLWELNIGVVTDSLVAAILVAIILTQRAVYDIKNQREIDCGGRGQQIQFPNYPLEQRLLDLGVL
jgi:hypothetical protein